MNEGRKRRILHVLKSSIYSGAENVVITLMKAMSDNFCMVYVATDGEIRKKLEQENISNELLPKFGRAELKKVIQKYQPDVVHAHDFSATVLCASLKHVHQFCLISHLHYDPPWVKTWNIKTLAYLYFLPRVDHVVTVTERMFDSMIFRRFCDDKHRALKNPMDHEKIRSLAYEQPGETSDRCNLIFVGRLVEQKNPQRFIQLVNLLKQDGYPNIQAWMLGDGNLWSECERLIEELNLEPNIKMLGFQSNPYRFMKCADVLCVTSGWEGFCLVAAEANVLGVPVLSTKTSGCTEVLGADAPELFETDEEFLGKMKGLLEQPEEMEAWKTYSAERAKRFMTIQTYQMEWDKIYRGET